MDRDSLLAKRLLTISGVCAVLTLLPLFSLALMFSAFAGDDPNANPLAVILGPFLITASPLVLAVPSLIGYFLYRKGIMKWSMLFSAVGLFILIGGTLFILSNVFR